MTNLSPEESAAVRLARRGLGDAKFLRGLHEALAEHLSEAVKEEDAVRIDMYAAALALVEDQKSRVQAR